MQHLALRVPLSVKPSLCLGYISPYFVTNADKMRVEMEDPYIFIYEKKLAGQPAIPRPCRTRTVRRIELGD
jgi:hypothetical protein